MNLNERLLRIQLDATDQCLAGSPFHNPNSTLNDVARCHMFGTTHRHYEIGEFVDHVDATYRQLIDVPVLFIGSILQFNLIIRKWEVIAVTHNYD